MAKNQKSKGHSQDGYQVPALKPGERHVTELIIKRSRFITSIARTQNVDEAKAFIAEITNENKEANHNCYAFNATAPGSTAFCGCSDDGEPKGTAGQPMLNVVLHCGVGELTAVVTRYFGGILLGTGGLVKAYQDCVKDGLDKLPTTEKMIESHISLGLDHRYIQKFKYLLPNYRATIYKETYEDLGYFDIVLPEHEADNLEAALVDLTKGAVKIIAKR